MSYLTVKFAFLKELQYYCKSIGIKFDEIENHLLNNEIILNLDEKNEKYLLNDISSLEYEIRKSNISTSILSATIRRLSEIN